MTVLNNNFFYRYKLHHVVFWLVYAYIWYLFGQLSTPPEHRGLNRETILINLVYLSTHMAASYISIYILMPRYLYRKKHLEFALTQTLNILFFSACIALGFYLVFQNNKEALDSIFQPGSIIPATLFSVLFTVMGLVAAKLFQKRKQAEHRNTQLEKEKITAELDYLKAQINPHFLFNAINNIYFLIKKDSTLAADMLLKFSELLRYQLYDCNTDTIAIDTEISYLHNFIELEKIRKEHVEVKVTNNIQPPSFGIAPLLLIPFVENAFKYVAFGTGEREKGQIDIEMENEFPLFLFRVSNTYKPHQPTGKRPGGIGIENVRRRLNLLYPNAHKLEITATEDHFIVKLEINYDDQLHHN